MLFTIVNKDDNELAIVNIFFLHPTKHTWVGGGWTGVTNIIPRTDLGTALINTSTNETQLLNHRITVNIPPHGSESFIVKYDLLTDKKSKDKAVDWEGASERMILGMTFIWPYITSGAGFEKTYMPLYKIKSKLEFEDQISEIYRSAKDEWVNVRARMR